MLLIKKIIIFKLNFNYLNNNNLIFFIQKSIFNIK